MPIKTRQGARKKVFGPADWSRVLDALGPTSILSLLSGSASKPTIETSIRSCMRRSMPKLCIVTCFELPARSISCTNSISVTCPHVRPLRASSPNFGSPRRRVRVRGCHPYAMQSPRDWARVKPICEHRAVCDRAVGEASSRSKLAKMTVPRSPRR